MKDTGQSQLLAERSQGIGGSDCASVFSLGYGCARRLWYEKRGVPADYPFDGNKATRLGKVLEPFFADEYAAETGREVRNPGQCDTRRDIPELLVHIDRLIWRGDEDGEWGVGEIKSLGRAAFYQARREGLNESYILQVQHGLVVTGLKFGVFILGCRDTGEIVYWDVELDANICATIETEVPAFWRDCVKGDQEPIRLDPDDARCKRCEYRRTCQAQERESPSTGLVAMPELAPLVERYKELDAQYSVKVGDKWCSELDAEYEEVREEIRSQLAGKDGAMVGDAKVLNREQEGREYWDMKGLLAAYRHLREDYMDHRRPLIGLPDPSFGPPEPERFVTRGRPFRTLRIYWGRGK